MDNRYQPTWNSLTPQITPKWLRDDKFGIYTHWGIYSVPAFGPNGTWYPHNMYREDTPQYAYHVKTYGDPSRFGYKDFIPQFTGEKFDPDEWAELFQGSGARFAGPVGEHHDGFAMWDTQLTQWNAARMGPKRDVVGELEKSYRKAGMRFMVALHHFENWFFFPHWKKEYDTADPRFAGLYGEAHDLEGPVGKKFFEQTKPSKTFLDLWLAKTKEVIDRFQPDLLWFDFGLQAVQEHYKREMLAYYYNCANGWGREVVVTYKFHDLVPGAGMIDLELGRFDTLTYHDWITDTTVDDGSGWGYLKDQKYKPISTLIHYLIDNVSKNGYLLLNVGPKPNGEIPEEAKEILKGMGKWLEINGEAIYGTTPWITYGEGPTQMTKAGYFMEKAEVKYTPQDIRFTAKGENLYAICLGWPTEPILIQSMSRLYESEIKSIAMLGEGSKLDWSLTPDGLRVVPPTHKPCEHAFVFKIERKRPL